MLCLQGQGWDKSEVPRGMTCGVSEQKGRGAGRPKRAEVATWPIEAIGGLDTSRNFPSSCEAQVVTQSSCEPQKVTVVTVTQPETGHRWEQGMW